MDIAKVKLVLTCTKCSGKFEIESSTGPSNICDPCTIPMLEAVYGEPMRYGKFGIEPVGGSSAG